MSFKKYRTIDIALLSIIYTIFEYIVIKAATSWFNEPYTVSIMLAMLLIIMIRWDRFVCIPCVIFGFLFVFLQNGVGVQYLIYILGNIGFLLTLVYVYKLGKSRITDSIFLTMLYCVIGFLTMEVSRGIAAICFTENSFAIISKFILTDMLTLVFTIVVMLIARKIDGLLMDQKQYVLKINKKKETNA